MLRECVSSCCLILLTTASLGVACGEVTTPEVEANPYTRTGDTNTDQPALQPSPDAGSDGEDDPGPSGDDDDDKDDEKCDPEPVPGLSITIGSADFDCDELRVVATAKDFEEDLDCSIVNSRCRCFGADERPGVYVVTVQLEGDAGAELAESREINVEMDEDNCHVDTEALTLRLPDRFIDAGVVDAGEPEDDPDPVEPDAGG